MEHAGEDGAGSDTLELSGALDVRRTAEVRDQVYGLLATGTGDVVVDISQVDSIDMTTLKLLAVANRIAEREGRHVVLRGATPRRTPPAAPLPPALADPAGARAGTFQV